MVKEKLRDFSYLKEQYFIILLYSFAYLRVELMRDSFKKARKGH